MRVKGSDVPEPKKVPGTEYRVLFFFLAGTGTGTGYRVPGTVLSLAGTDPDTSFRYRVHFFPLRVPSTRFIKKKKKSESC